MKYLSTNTSTWKEIHWMIIPFPSILQFFQMFNWFGIFKVETMWKFSSGILHFRTSESLTICKGCCFLEDQGPEKSAWEVKNLWKFWEIQVGQSPHGQLDGPERKMTKQITVQQSGLRKWGFVPKAALLPWNMMRRGNLGANNYMDSMRPYNLLHA